MNGNQIQKRPSIDLSTLVYGKVPPQAKEMEMDVLGAIQIEPGIIDRVTEFVTDESFYIPAHQIIYRAMIGLHQKGQPTDTRMVVEELLRLNKLEEVGGPYYVTSLTKRVSSTGSIEKYAQIIAQKYMQRELIRIGGEIVSRGYEHSTDVFELLDEAEESILTIGRKHVQGDVKGIDQVLIKALHQIEQWRQEDTHVTGVPSGFGQMDKATRGWQPGNLIIMAARPSIGKTSYSLRLARNAAMNKTKPVPTALFSLEMEDMELVLRMLSAESGIMLYRLQTGRMQDADMKDLYQKGVQPLASAQIFIDDEAGLTLMKLRAKARRLKKKYNIGLIIVDYLQLMSSEKKNGNREQEISGISRGLKLLAKELGVPIIALSQLSRAVESRTGPKRIPQLSDLRESGAIEQDADMVIFLWGPEDDEIEADASLLNRRYIRIAKARNGMLMTLNYEINKDTQEWEEAPANGFVPIQQTIQGAPRMPYKDDTNDHDQPF